MPSEKEIEAATKAYWDRPTKVGAPQQHYIKAALEAAEKVREPELQVANDRIKVLEKALRLVRVSSDGKHCDIVRCVDPELFGGMDGDIPFSYHCPEAGYKDIADAVIVANKIKQALQQPIEKENR